MAWNGSNAWKSPPPHSAPRTNDSSFPGLKPATQDANYKIEYAELQRNELDVLEAIYGEDFVNHTGAQSAWKVCNEQSRYRQI
jgi:eukaryotic translation initiation factor 2-alpha kinase 4